MSELTPNAFIGYAAKPTDEELAAALGAVKTVWDRIIVELASRHGADVQEWKCYSAKSGWSLRLKRGKRTILYLAPCAGSFHVLFILGDKAVAAARQSDLSKRALRLLDEAERYPEGTGVRMEVRGTVEVATILKLAAIKAAN